MGRGGTDASSAGLMHLAGLWLVATLVMQLIN
jgi:hypothetical protein